MLSLDLIRNLAASNTDNAIESITSEIRRLALKHNWTIEEAMEVGELVTNQRAIAINSTIETAQIVTENLVEGGQ